jgi:RHS repeat-associated protein
VNGQLTSATTAAPETTQTRRFTYDGLGLPRSEESPEKNAPVNYLSYDARGHARHITDGTSDLTYTYDPWERLTTVGNTGGSDIKSFTFGTTNLPEGCTTNCSNFQLGKLVTAVRYQTDPALGGPISVTEHYEYVRASGQVSDRDTTISSTGAFPGASFKTFQDYNLLGALNIIGYPKCLAPAGCVAATAAARPSDMTYYDYKHGWLTFVGSNGDDYAKVSYQPNGVIDTVTHHNGLTETWAPDPDGMPRPCGIFAYGKGTELVADSAGDCGKAIAGASGIRWSSGRYSFDGAGNIRQVGPKQYLYDGAGRLTSESASSSTATESYHYSLDYKYDAFGNMIQRALARQSASTLPGGDGAVGRTLTVIPVDAASNRLSTATYDASGNMTASDSDPASRSLYAWDSIGTMRSLTESGRDLHYLYTADDERVAIVSLQTGSPGSSASTTWTIRGMSNQVLRTIVDDNSTGTHVWSWSADEIYRGQSLVADVTPAGIRHFALDHLGSPRLITDSSANGNPSTNDFSAFGSGGMTGSGPLQFTGHERDWGSDGVRTLDYMHARYYSAAGARFLSVDPVLNSVDLIRPQSLNRYSYVENNPLLHTDRTGRCAEDGCVGEAAALLAAGAVTTVVDWAIGTAFTVGMVDSIYNLIDPPVAAMGADVDVPEGTSLAEHVKGARPSTAGKHEKGQGRRVKDRGREKGDARRRPPRKRPR